MFAISGTVTAQTGWIQKPFFGGGTRTGASSFSIGGKGYILLGNNDTTFKNDIWEYDTLTSVWTKKADFPGEGRDRAVSFAIGNKGYVGTGFGANGPLKDFWQYDPALDKWTQKADFGGTARYLATGFAIGGKGYIGTGHDGLKENDFWEYDTLTNKWTQKAFFTGLERYEAFGFSIGDKGYIGGGLYTGSGSGGLGQDFYEYNPANDTWTKKANIKVYDATSAIAFSIGSQGYVLSGNGGAGSNLGVYDQATDKWILGANLTQGRTHGTGFSIGNRGYIGTGLDGTGRKKDFWKYTPCYPFPLATITPSGPLTFCQGGSVTLTANPALSYIWWNSATTQSITVTSTATLAVMVTDVCGTATSSPVTVTVLTCTGVNESITENGITIYPNPFSERTTLQANMLNATLTIYNSLGQEVKQIKNISGQTLTIDREGLPNGLYLLKLTQDDQLLKTDKLIIQD